MEVGPRYTAAVTPLRVLLPALLGAALAAQDTTPLPTFVEGDPAQLSCQVVDADVIDKWANLLTIEVQNGGAAAAEPLVFELSWTDRKSKEELQHRVDRVRLPHMARYGNPTPAGGKKRYLVRSHLPFKKGHGKGSVRVSAASFYRGGAVEAPDLGIGRPEQVQRDSLAGTFPITKVTLRNPFDRDLDVLLRVKLSQPLNCDELYGVRLPAATAHDWLLTSRPGRSMYLDPDGAPGTPVKAVRFEVVDWSLIGVGDPKAGAALLRPAYEAWYRWPGDGISVGGNFVMRERHLRINTTDAYDDFSIEGRFTIGSNGNPKVEIKAGAGASPDLLLRTAFADLLRPDFATFAADNELRRIAPDRVVVIGPGWDVTQPRMQVLSTGHAPRFEDHEDLTVQDGHIRSSGRGDGGRTQWEHRRIGRHQVRSRADDGSTETTWAFCEADGRLLPTVVTSITRYGDRLYRSGELQLTDLRFTGVAEIRPTPPTGAGTAALRAIWASAFRVTSEPIVIEAKFRVTNPGTDLLWRGHDKLGGKVSMRGIGRHLQSASFDFDGKLAPETQLELAAVIRDRWLMWYSRDFSARPTFDEFFRGATIAAADAAGDFAVGGGLVQKVMTTDGKVDGFRRVDGTLVKFAYQKVGDVQVTSRITEQHDRWTATTSLTWKRIGDHILPTRMKFERIFDRAWGPETITLESAHVK